MKQLNILLLFAVLSIMQHIDAQTPGYMGKRFLVKAELLTTPTFYSANDVADYARYEEIATINGFGFSFTPSLGIEYVLGKSVSAGMAFRTSSLPLPMGYYQTSEIYDPETDVYTHYGYFGEGKVKSTMTSLYFKFYRHEKRGSIAPLGRFHQLEFIFGKSGYSTGELVITDPTNEYAPFVATEDYQYVLFDEMSELGFNEKYPFHLLKYAYGFETVLYDKIPFDISMQLAFRITDYLEILQDDGIVNKNEYEYELKTNIAERFDRSLNLTFNVGLGYLVF